MADPVIQVAEMINLETCVERDFVIILAGDADVTQVPILLPPCLPPSQEPHSNIFSVDDPKSLSEAPVKNTLSLK